MMLDEGPLDRWNCVGVEARVGCSAVLRALDARRSVDVRECASVSSPGIRMTALYESHNCQTRCMTSAPHPRPAAKIRAYRKSHTSQPVPRRGTPYAVALSARCTLRCTLNLFRSVLATQPSRPRPAAAHCTAFCITSRNYTWCAASDESAWSTAHTLLHPALMMSPCCVLRTVESTAQCVSLSLTCHRPVPAGPKMRRRQTSCTFRSTGVLVSDSNLKSAARIIASTYSEKISSVQALSPASTHCS